jgi:hypothetical protein
LREPFLPRPTKIQPAKGATASALKKRKFNSQPTCYFAAGKTLLS